jgi:hypothetical protein
MAVSDPPQNLGISTEQTPTKADATFQRLVTDMYSLHSIAPTTYGDGSLFETARYMGAVLQQYPYLGVNWLVNSIYLRYYMNSGMIEREPYNILLLVNSLHTKLTDDNFQDDYIYDALYQNADNNSDPTNALDNGAKRMHDILLKVWRNSQETEKPVVEDQAVLDLLVARAEIGVHFEDISWRYASSSIGNAIQEIALSKLGFVAKSQQNWGDIRCTPIREYTFDPIELSRKVIKSAASIEDHVMQTNQAIESLLRWYRTAPTRRNTQVILETLTKINAALPSIITAQERSYGQTASDYPNIWLFETAKVNLERLLKIEGIR